MRRPEGFTSRRRRYLAKKVDRLDRLETRNTMTEPISVVGLMMGSLRWLDQLGIVDKRLLGNPVSGPAPPDQATAQGQVQAQKPPPAPDSFDSIMASTQRSDSAVGAGGGSAAPADPTATARATANNSDDWLAFNTSSESGSTETGFSTPWQPAKGPGGGAALPPRGGSAGGPRGSRPALRGAIAPLTLPPSIPSAHIGGAGAPSSPPPNAAAGSGHHAIAGSQPSAPAAPTGGSGASSPTGSTSAQPTPGTGPVSADSTPGDSSPTPTGPTIIPENPSSLPYTPPVSGGDSPLTPGAPAFPVYTLDYIQGTVLLPNAYQLATLDGNVDLRAQATGTTGVTYSWNTTGLTDATSIAGASTYDLTFTWSQHVGTAALNSVTLTATNSSSQQVVQTYYFQVPVGNVTTNTGTASWPTTLAPNTVSLNATEWASQYVSVNSNSGALDTEIDLPSYNPNVPALALTYDSLTANPLPMIVVEHPLDPTQAVPSKVSAQLTFNSTAGTAYYFNTSQWTPGDVEQIALQATSASTLATGRYSYSVQVVDYRSTNTTTTYTGTATVLNQSSSAFGDGWTLEGLEKITPATDNSGVILNLGNAGATLWFAGNPSVGGSYTTPAGDFSTLTKTSTGYTDVLADGTQITFNSAGYETATIDLNNQHITYSYNGSNQLTTITDNYNNNTTFTYSGSDLSTIKDPAGRLATFTFSGSNLAAVQQADGTHVSYSYDSAGRLTQVKDPLSNVVTVSYDSAERVGTITRPDLTTEEFSSFQEQGYNTSGTSGSPAPTVLLAASVASYTDPNLNAMTLRTDWFGLGTTGILTDATGNFTTYDRNSNGLPTITIDRLDRIDQYSYDSLGNMTEEIYPDLYTDQYTYNSDSEPLTHTDANNHTTSFSYDGHGNLAVIQDPLNNRTTMTYTSTGRLQTSTDANNHTTTYQYDSQDRVTTVVNPDSTTVLTSYNSQGNAIKVSDERGNSTTFSFDALNRETGSTDALTDITRHVYDADGNLKVDQEPTPAGQTARTTTYAYDSMNRLTTTTAALSLVTVNSYDADGNLVSVKDPMGRITTTVYDQLNRPVVTIDPMGNHVTTTYDAEGQVVTVTDALNRTTTYTYSIRGWVSTVTDPMGYTATYIYSPTGMETAEQQYMGGEFQAAGYTYDADDREIVFSDGLGHNTTFGYDGIGNRTSVTDANSNITTSVYKSRNELIEEIEPLGVTVSYGYDASGNQQTVTDALGHTSTTLYDALDRATTMISAVSGTTTITYDAAGRETSLTDPVGNKTQWAYDAEDRVTTLTQPNNATVTYVYDNDGELTDTTDADGRRTTYSYNADGDQTGETWVGATPAEKVTYTYDADNEMTGAADSYATLTFTYNNDGELATDVTSGPGTGQPTVTLTYSYDQLGDETSVSDSLSSQGIATYAYDVAQRSTTITTSYGGSAGPQVTYTYLCSGQPQSDYFFKGQPCWVAPRAKRGLRKAA